MFEKKHAKRIECVDAILFLQTIKYDFDLALCECRIVPFSRHFAVCHSESIEMELRQFEVRHDVEWSLLVRKKTAFCQSVVN